MNNELIEHKSWWKRNRKWFVPASGLLVFLIFIVLYSGMGRVGADLAQAYSEDKLYENAWNKLKFHPKVTALLGEIEPIDDLAILEGEVHYTNDNKTVNSSIRLKGSKGNARMDIRAVKVGKDWNYKIINVRIKNPLENKQTIEILKID